MTEQPRDRQRLHRQLDLPDAIGIGLGAVIGGGIFVVTGLAASLAGPALLVGLFLAAIAATCNAMSSAELAAQNPESGGTYEYGYQLLGAWPGFIAGWMFLASKMAAAGVVALGLGAYARMLVPAIEPRILSVVAILLFTALNYFGVRRTSRINLVIVTTSIISLLLLVTVGARAFEIRRLLPFAPGGVGGVLEAAALLFFAYTGYARIATLGEEVRDPRRTIPRAILATILSAALLYGTVAFVAIGIAGAPALASTAAPLAVAARAAGGEWLTNAVAIGALTAMLGVILSQILGMSRMLFAMGRRGDLPRWLARVHPKHGIPHRAVLIVGTGAAVIAATGSLGGVAAAASFAILLYYAIANLAALRLQPPARLYPSIVPAIGLLSCVLLAFSLRLPVIGIGLAVLLTGILVRVAMRLTK